MIPDGYIHDRRMRALRELPWVIPAAVIMQLRDEDLDWLGCAGLEEHPTQYWRILNGVVRRITGEDSPLFGPELTNNTKANEGRIR